MAAVGARAGIWCAGGSGRMAGTAGSARNLWLEPAEFLDAGSLLETSGWLKQQFLEDADKNSRCWRRCCASLGDFRDLQTDDRRCVSAQRGDQRRRVQHLARSRASIQQTRDSIQKTLRQILRSRQADSGEDYVTSAQRPFVIPVRSEQSAECSGCGAWRPSGNRADVFVSL